MATRGGIASRAWRLDRRGRALATFGAATVAAGALAAAASASQLIDRDASGVRLVVTRNGAAHLLYTAAGQQKHVVAYGAVNARFPQAGRQQVAFQVNYNAGYGTPYYMPPGAPLANTCRRYDGPRLPWLVAGCKAKDGYWAVQSWQRMLPNQGRAPTAALAVSDLRLSHWRGPLPVLTVKEDWAYAGMWQHIYGKLTYRGRPMFGYKTTSLGAPLDNWSVLLYLDALDSAIGSGWRRAESFVTHNPTGIFCYLVSPHHGGPAARGSQHRITAVGPGVLPDVAWAGKSPGPYDRARDEKANEEQRRSFSDKVCRPN